VEEGGIGAWVGGGEHGRKGGGVAAVELRNFGNDATFLFHFVKNPKMEIGYKK
jgi:hypothetical protein